MDRSVKKQMRVAERDMLKLCAKSFSYFAKILLTEELVEKL
jgi:hypothetical protein